MSLSEMNKVLVQVYTNDLFRKYFFEKPQSALSYYKDLDSEEKEALTSLDKEKVNEFSTGLRLKTQFLIEKYYKPLFDNYHAMTTRYFQSFYLIRKLSNHENNLEYAINFGEYLKESLSGILEYRHLYFSSIFLLQKLKAVKIAYPEFYVNSKEITADGIPVLYPHVFLETYPYDMPAAIKNITETSFNESYFSYVMYNINGLLKIDSISNLLSDFLNTCNSIYSLAEIYDTLKRDYGRLIKNKWRDIISILIAKRYIYIK